MIKNHWPIIKNHWPIIATIIAVLNAWAIFWLEWYFDRKAATKASASKGQLTKEAARTSRTTGIKEHFKANWQTVGIQWVFNFIAVSILVRFYASDSPVTHGAVILDCGHNVTLGAGYPDSALAFPLIPKSQIRTLPRNSLP